LTLCHDSFIHNAVQIDGIRVINYPMPCE
jgi:hypothetical protein